MSEPYKPLFNRTYLTVLVWFSAIAVLILANMGDEAPDYISYERAPDQPVFWIETESERNEVALLLPTGSALTRDEKLLQQLLSNVLENQLSAVNLPAATRFAISQSGDHLTLNLRWPEDETSPDWQVLLNQLNQPVDPYLWQPLIEKLKARAYLQSHKVDNKLLDAYFGQLVGGEIGDLKGLLPSRYQTMLANARYFVSGEDADEIAEDLLAALPQTSENLQSVRTLFTDPTELLISDPRDNRYHLLLGNSLPNRNDAEFPAYKLAAHSLQDALNQQAQQGKLEFRLVWSSLQDSGYQALLLHSDQPLPNQLKAVEQRLTAELVKANQTLVIKQWHARMSDQQNQIEALKVVAFYGLPADTLAQYPQQLEALEPEQVAAIARRSVQPEHQIRIQFAAH